MTFLKPLLYFSLFKYPLTASEIFDFSDASSDQQIDHVKAKLDELAAQNVIYKIDKFYLCENNEALIERRLKGNEGAKRIQQKAIARSKFISKFPYVEGVGISGSLSKGFYDEKDGDIDFFIITKHQRLWIARTILIIYKKIFLLNSKKYFCVNYFISEHALEISEKNRFTATELVTLMPMFGNGSFHEFYKKNKWVYSFLPNMQHRRPLENLSPIKKPIISLFLERIFNTSLGNSLDRFFMKITYKKWKVKFNDLSENRLNIAMKSTQNVSKHHPNDYQNKVINRLNEKYLEYNKNHNINLPLEHA